MSARDPVSGCLLVVQPSADYAFRVRRHAPDAVFLATPDRAPELAGHPVIVADLDDGQGAAAAVGTWCSARAGRRRGPGVDGITCFVCERLEVTAEVARHLGLPFHSPATVCRSRHKDESLLAWRTAGVPLPASRFIGGLPDLLDFSGAVRPPWILKPTDRSGSEWVLRVDGQDDLLGAHLRIREGLAASAEPHRAGDPPRYLAQELVQGRELSADLFIDAARLVRALRWTEKYLVHEPGLAGLVGAYFAAQLTGAEEDALRRTCERAAVALGVERGLVMVDGILRDGAFHLLEMGLRPGGDCLPDLCQRSTGYDPVRAACQVALGRDPDGPERAPERIAALHLMARVGGTITRLDLTDLEAHPAVVHVDPYRGVGDSLRVWAGSYDDRIVASCLARFDAVDELPDLIGELSARIRLDVVRRGDGERRRA